MTVADPTLPATSLPDPSAAEEVFVFPATFAQRRLWFLDRLSPGLPLYNIPTALGFTGDLEPAALARTLEAVVERHEVLRTTFRTLGGELMQVVAPAARVPLPVVDLSRLSGERRDAELDRLVTGHARHRFDLARGPLLDCRLVRLGQRDHAALLNLHHTVGDAWSLELLVDEVGRLYPAAVRGEDPQGVLPPLELQVGDFAQAQADFADGEVAGRDLELWRRRLAGIEPLALPYDRPPGPSAGAPGAQVSRTLPAGTREALDRLVAASGATRFMVFAAGVQALLARLTGRDDLVVGTVTAGREHAATEGMIGCFVDTLVLSVDASGRPSFRDLLERVRERMLEAVDHRAVTFDRLVEELRPERELGRTPFFDVMVRVGETRPATLDLPGLAVSELGGSTGTAKFDWSLLLADSADSAEPSVSLTYRTDRFEPATAAMIVDTLGALLAAAVAAPGTRLDELPLLAPGAADELARLGDGGAPEPLGQTLHGPVFERLATAPDAVVLVEPDGTERTGAWLAGRAWAVARQLQGQDLAPEEVVAVQVERSGDLVAALLGVLAAGGAFLALDPDDPAERRAFVLDDSGARLSITDRFLADLAEIAELPPPSPIDPRQAAYLLYTSGSTGVPKGSLVPHGAIAATLGWLVRRFGGRPGERTAIHKTPVSFDVAVRELFWPLAEGVPLVLAAPGLHRRPGELARAMESSGVTEVHFVPSLLGAWLEAVEEGRAGVGRLERVFTGGEVLGTDLVERLTRVAPGVELVDGYGLTETAVTVTAGPVTVADREGDRPPAIGRPGAGRCVSVVDRNLRPLPPGAMGEILVAGPGLARGYRGRPGQTAERFVPDLGPNAPEGSRAYRTGDLGRWLPSGELAYLGRLDQQLQIRGVRVEPAEVEAVLGRHPAVGAVVVVPVAGSLGALIVASGGTAAPSRREVADFAAGALPGPLVPSLVRVADELPVTASGKVDRRRVAELLAAAPDAADGAAPPSRAPRGPVEALLVEIWSAVLERRDGEVVGVDDDFFDLGGHSLLATRLVSRVERVLGRALPLAAVFEHPTVAGIARYLEGSAAFTDSGPIRRLPRPADGGPFRAPVSFAQQRLWFLDRLAPGNPFYDMASALRLRGPLALAALGAAFADLVERHESLRTTFEEIPGGGGVEQLIHPPSPVPLPVVDLAALPEAARVRAFGWLLAGAARRPFDLARGPLLDLVLVRAKPVDHTLLANLHHIVSDGWSQGILVAEVAALYRARRREDGGDDRSRGAGLAPLPVQYADFAAWQRLRIDGGATRRLLDHWRERLAGLPDGLALPFDRPRPTVDRFVGGALSFELDAPLVESLRRLGRRTGATLSMVTLAAFQGLLGRLAGEDDVAVGVAVANRDHAEIEPLIGFFVNTLVLRVGVADDAGFGRLVEGVREIALDAYAHQELPFERLVEELAPERSLDKNPLVQVMFGYQNFPRAEIQVDELVLEAPAVGPQESGSSKFDLTLFLHERDGALGGTFQFNRDLFDRVTVQRLARHLEAFARAGVEAPEAPLAELAWLSPGERHQVRLEQALPAVSAMAAMPVDDLHGERGLPALVEARAAAAPDAPAVVTVAGRSGGPSTELSYGELVARARGLAARLVAQRVAPGDRVGLAVERSGELVVAMLGILRAGAVYVPLDRDFPAERTRLMVDDSRLVALVTDPAADPPAGTEGLPTLTPGGPGAESGGASLPALGALDGDLAAYVVYTSGSTGVPKGVEVSHRAVARLAVDARLARPGERVGQAATATFDAITWEVWAPLVLGGTVVVLPRDLVLEPTRLAAVLAEQAVDALFLTTALFDQIVRVAPGAFAPLRTVLTGGEAVDPASLAAVLAAGGRVVPANIYGPTETTTFASLHPLERPEPGAATVPIGRPVAGTTLYVTDAALGPCPLGVPGELVVGSAGVALGYVDRPRLTAERFTPDPFSTASLGRRLYRTGDLVRRRHDGAVEFLGRIDQQVKLRGHRIELGEIDATLAHHPAVAASVTVLDASGDAGPRLVAYVVQDPDWRPEGADDGADEHPEGAEEAVEEWTLVFDDLYRRPAADDDPTFNIVGWESTYTGAPLPAAHMRVWLDDTLAAIRRVTPPGSKVLELGSGTGLLLLQLAPEAALYVGTDVSAQAIEYVAAQVEAAGGLPQVRLLERPADRLDGLGKLAVGVEGKDGTADDRFDTVILNSVVQYFPTPEYLAGVLEGAARLLAPGGSLFVGDVRSLPLLDAFQADVALHQAADDDSLDAVRQAFETRRLDEGELAVAPAFFAAVARRAGFARVTVFPKAGAHHDELTGYRFQALLEKAPERAETPERVRRLDWRLDGLDGAGLAELLAAADATAIAIATATVTVDDGPDALVVRGIPNPRPRRGVLARELLADRSPSDARTAVEAREWIARRLRELAAESGIDPHALLDPATSPAGDAWEVALGWGDPGPRGDFDAVFVRRGAVSGVEPAAAARALVPSPAAAPDAGPERWASRPLQGRFARRLAPELATHLGRSLPEWMVPKQFVSLAELPLNPAGKVDRRRLPAPDRGELPSDGGEAPRGPVEGAVAAILEDLLGVTGVGRDSDFFDLGGHSLLATRVISHLRRDLGVEIALRSLFEKPTVRQLAELVIEAERMSAAAAQAPPIRRLDRQDDGGLEAVLSYAQERLWFLAALDPSASAYNEADAVRVLGRLHLAALARALEATVVRHESLRTTFFEGEGADGPLQRIAPPGDVSVPLPVVDLSGLAPDRRDGQAHRQALVLRRLPFDLERGPIWFPTVMRLADDDHVLLFNFHHIVFDGWSRSYFSREVSHLYRRQLDPSVAPLAPLPIQYADFSAWQRGWLSGNVLGDQMEFWRRTADGVPPLDLVTDRPRRSRTSPVGATLTFRLGDELTERLHALGRARGATLYMVTAAGAQALLARTTGQTDFALGMPIAQRNRAEIEPLLGFFVNMLVLRADVVGDPPFAELVDRVRERSLAAYAHQDLPFEKLVGKLVPDRDLGRHPLFQVGFQLFNAAPAHLELPGTELGFFEIGGRGVKFDLDFSLLGGSEGQPLGGNIYYDSTLFDPTTVRRLVDRYRVLLTDAVEHPERSLSALAHLTVSESQQVAVEWPRRPDPSRLAHSLHGPFVDAARRAPRAVAAVSGDASWSYARTAAAAAELGRRLVAAGVGSDSRVGVALAARVDRPTAYLAVLAAGGAFVPLDPYLPPERLAFLLRDAEIGLVVAAPDWGAPELRDGREPTVLAPPVDPGEPTDPEAAVEGLAALVAATGSARRPDHAAYVLYTSGSTGTPKGVMVGHGAAAAFVAGAQAVLGLGPSDRFAQVGSVGFDVSVFETFVPLAAGASLDVVPRGERLDPEELVADLARREVTAAAVVPALAELLDPDELPALHTLVVGGDRCPADLPARWRGRRFVNAYGPTETVAHVTVWTAPSAPSGPSGPSERGGGRDQTPPVGRPQAPATIQVVDPGFRPTALGAVGEIVVGGPTVARGYLGRPAETAAAFVPDPFARSTPGSRLYRTGDLGRWSTDGQLHFEGRLDFQVKVRGVRVEPGEVERVLEEHPAVEEAAVVFHDGSLVAWVVGAGGRIPDARELRRLAAERLQAAMVPTVWRSLPELPRLAVSGKVDRAALRRRSADLAAGAAETVGETLATGGTEASARSAGPADLGATVDLVAELWRDLLGLEELDPASDFFELGGHSLLALRMLGRVRSTWKVELPVRSLFEAPTVSGLAATIDRQVRREAGGDDLVEVPLERAEPPFADDAWPLTSAQRRLWVLDRLEPGSAVYNMPLSLRLDGPLEPAALARALGQLLARHQALGVRFAERGGEPVQILVDRGTPELGVVDLAGLDDSGRAAELRRLARREHRTPFDLARGPLLRATLVRLGEVHRSQKSHALLATVHHIAADGWSLEVMLRDLLALLDGEELVPLPLRFVDLAVWETRWWATGVPERQLARRRDALAGTPPLELPADRPRPERPSGRGGSVPVTLGPEASERLARLAREHRSTVYMAALAGFVAFLSRVTGQDDVAVGSPIAHRDRRELEDMVGFLVDMLVTRTRVEPGRSFAELLEAVREVTLEAYARRDLPFEKLVEAVDRLGLGDGDGRGDGAGDGASSERRRTLSRNPLFQVAFQVLPGGGRTVSGRSLPEADGRGKADDAGTLTVSSLGTAGDGPARFDLYLSLREGDDGLAGGLEYSGDLFTREAAERLARGLEILLEAAAREPERPVAELPLLTRQEHRRLTVGLDGPRPDFRGDVPLALRVEEAAAKNPEAPAVVAGDITLTYGELVAASRRLARRLAAVGAGPGDLVGIALERSADLVVALLATLRAGAAYVPLDPDYPRQRLEAMVADARPAALVVASAASAEAWEAAVDCPVVPVGALDELAQDAAPVDDGDLPGDLPEVATGGDHLAYVTYTSGSTGEPKGVAVPQAAVARLVTGVDYVDLGPDDVVGQIANASFDAATFEIWGALVAGARLEILPTEVVLEPRRLAAELRRSGVTVLFVTTALFNRLVAEEPGVFSGLRTLLFGGEAVDPRAVSRLLAERPPERLLHVYGPTEATTFATWYPVETVAAGATTVPIGRPLANTRAVVLDRTSRPVPVGVVGELFLGGPGLARGYLGRPAATAERFVPDPFSTGDPGDPGDPVAFGSRLYRTGDLVRRDAAGAISFVGRADRQVKLRGFRIEPGEIEAVLAAHPAVGKAVVVVSDGRGGRDDGARLVAYVTPGEGHRVAPSAEELKGHCRESLPTHLVPAAFMALGALPLTPNGKVDRRALPEPEDSAFGTSGVDAPRTPVEVALVGLWAELLGRTPGIHDDFFDVGGQSLSAIQLISRVRDELGVEVELRSLFERPTVAGLAQAVETVRRTEGGIAPPPPLVPLTPAERDRPQPLSFAQQRLFLLDQLEMGDSAYNLPLSVRFDGDLRLPALARTVAEILRRHQVLRVAFGWRDGEPVQETEPFEGLDGVGLPVVDLSRLDEPRALAEGRRIAGAFALAPFDLSLDRTVRLGLVRLDPRAHLFLCTLHHIAADGWSLGVFQRELAALYRARLEGRAPTADELPALPVQYVDYAVWQRRWLEGENLERLLDHWRLRLDGVEDLALPTDRPRGLPSVSGAAVAVRLDRELSDRLTALGRAVGGTAYTVTLALWQLLLARVTGQWDFAVGTPVAGRNRAEIEPLVGFFVNTLVMRSALDPAAGFRSTLDATRETILDAFAHQEMPFQRLVAELVPERRDRRRRRSPLFQTLFALQNAPSQEVELPGLALSPVGAAAESAKFEFSLSLAETPDGFAGSLEYRTALFDRSTIERWAGYFETLARAVAAAPEVPLDALALLDPDAARELAVSPVPPGFGQGLEAAYTVDGRAWAGRVAAADGLGLVVDRPLALAPAGVAGELAVAGAGLPWGFDGDPAGTAVAFVPDPFGLGAEPGSRLWRTGERVRRTRNGGFEALGRLDDRAPVPPRTAAEELVAGLLRSGSGDDFGIHTELAAVLPGDDPVATLAAHLADADGAVGIELPSGLAGPRTTLAQLASRLEETLASGAGEAPPWERADRDGVLPLSFAQEAVWSRDEATGGTASDHLGLVLTLDGELGSEEIGALGAAVVRLQLRHEALRTGFGWRDGAPVQEIDDPSWIELDDLSPLPLVDLSALGADASGAVAELFDRRLRTAFDLGFDRLVRFTLARLAPERHLLQVAAHALVMDEASLGRLAADLAILLADETGDGTALPELPFAPADAAARQRAWLGGAARSRALGAWRLALAGLPPLDLPTDRPRGAVTDGDPAARRWVEATLSAPAAAAVRTLAAERGVPVPSVLLAAWAAVLACTAATWDVAVAVSGLGPRAPELEGAVGRLDEPLLARVRLTPSVGGPEAVGAAHDALGAARVRDLPASVALGELGEGVPPVRAAFAWQQVPELPPLPGFEVSTGSVVSPAPGVGAPGADGPELVLSLAARSDGSFAGSLEGAFVYDPTTLRRLARRLDFLLRRWAEEPATPLVALDLLAPAERHGLLLEHGDVPPVVEWREATVVDLFACHARRQPEAPALVDHGRRQSYRQLDETTWRLARHLRNLGVGRGDPVALLLPPSLELVVAELAVAKSSGAYVPLATGDPAERLDWLLDDTGARVVVTTTAHARSLPPRRGLEIVTLDGPGAAVLRELSPEPLDDPPRGDDLAYVIYTSGSTGVPKGVEVPHRGIVRLVRPGKGPLDVGPDDRTLLVPPVTFDVSTFEVWSALANGGSVAVLSAPEPSLADYGRALRELGVTVAWLTSGLFALLTDERLEDLAGLRILAVGGDVVPVPQARRVIEELPGVRLVDGYGPTENTTFTTSHRVTERDLHRPSIPIGRPVPGSTAHVVDRQLRLLPPGVPGELVTGGLGVARGYRGQPAKTAEAFVPDPWSDLRGEPGARLYKTGDLARTLADGGLEFFGRMDHQVKIRGFRVEPDEVAAVVADHPQVSEAVVVARPDRRGDMALTAYVVPSDRAREAGESPEGAVAVLREHLALRLPDYMVPAGFVVLDALPLSASGKVDRHALPEPGQTGATERPDYAPPRTELERTIAEIWRDVLRVERVGRDDSFFDLGGHSLVLLQAVGRLSEVVGRELPRDLMFEHPTVATLARELEASGGVDVEGESGRRDRPSETEAAVDRARDRGAERRRSGAGRRARGERGGGDDDAS